MKTRVLDESQFAAVINLVRTRTGLAFAESRWQQAESGIRQTMQETGITDPDRLVRLLHTSDQVFQALVEKLTVAETYFFREREQFELLRRLVLPQLHRHIHQAGRLRLWSAGCATGEEPYSLAILLEQEGLAGQASIIGTDISRASLTLARKASYGAWSFRDNSSDFAEQYFQRRGERMVLIERIRRAVEFDVFNLASEIYPSRISGPTGLDLILCRNVLIYFDPDTVERVARQMFASLREDGWLITGPSDPPLWQHAPYEPVLTSAGVLYCRRPGATAIRKMAASVKNAADVNRTTVARRGTGSSAPSPKSPIALPHARAPAQPAAIAPGEEDKSCPKHLEDRISELQALANTGDSQCATAAMAAALEAHPLSPEIHYLQAVVLLSLGRYDEAAESLRRVIYLDRSMAVAHFTLASILQRRGAVAEARRCFRNVLKVCDDRLTDEIVPFSDGEQTGRLVEAARTQLDLIRDSSGRRS